MSEEKVLTLRGKRAVWAPAPAGGGGVDVFVVKVIAHTDTNGNFNMSADKTPQEIFNAQNEGKLPICLMVTQDETPGYEYTGYTWYTNFGFGSSYDESTDTETVYPLFSGLAISEYNGEATVRYTHLAITEQGVQTSFSTFYTDFGIMSQFVMKNLYGTKTFRVTINDNGEFEAEDITPGGGGES